MSRDISVDEWLQALQQVQDAPDGAMTTEELAAQVGHSTEWVRKRLRHGMSAGVLRVTPVKVPRTALDGSRRLFTGYRITVLSSKKRR